MCNLTFSIAILHKLTRRACFEITTALFSLATIGTRRRNGIRSVVHISYDGDVNIVWRSNFVQGEKDGQTGIKIEVILTVKGQYTEITMYHL